MTRWFAFIALTLVPFSGCVCTQDVPLASCIMLEEGIPFSPTIPIDGAIVDDELSRDALRSGFSNCGQRRPAHEVTIDRGEAGLALFAWGHEAADLAVDFVVAEDSALLVEEIQTGWSGGAAFVIHDDEGLALAVNGVNFAIDVPGVVVEHGNWKALGATICGTFSHTDTKVTVAGAEPVFVSTGDSASIEIDGTPFSFHAFSAGKLEEWHVGSSRVDLQACKLEYSIVSPK